MTLIIMHQKVLSTLIQDQLLAEGGHQIVEGFTRSELVNGVVVQSSIDHVYTNTPNKCSKPVLESAWDSDHLASFGLIAHSENWLHGCLKPRLKLEMSRVFCGVCKQKAQ